MEFKKFIITSSSSRHRGSERHLSAFSQGLSGDRQETGASDPSAAVIISATVYSSGVRARR